MSTIFSLIGELFMITKKEKYLEYKFFVKNRNSLKECFINLDFQKTQSVIGNIYVKYNTEFECKNLFKSAHIEKYTVLPEIKKGISTSHPFKIISIIDFKGGIKEFFLIYMFVFLLKIKIITY